MTPPKKMLLALVGPAVLSLSLCAPALAQSRGPAVDAVASGCTPAAGTTLCSGSLKLTYLGKTTTFAPAECHVPSVNSTSFEIFYNYNFYTSASQVPGKFFIAWASMAQGVTTYSGMRMKWDLSSSQSKQTNVASANLTIKVKKGESYQDFYNDSSGKITATDHKGRAILATFTCK